MSLLECSSSSACFRGGLSATRTHSGLKQALAALQSAEKNAVLWFAEILRRKLYRDLGYSSIHAYAAEALGFTPSKISQFIRLAEALRELPELRRSVASGSLSWTKAREVAKVATPGTETEWIAQALAASNRELEAAVRSCREQERSGEGGTGGQGSLLESDAQGAPEALAQHTELPASNLAPAAHTGRPARCSAPGQGGIASSAACGRPKGLNLQFSPEERARFEALVEKIRKSSRAGAMRQARWETLVLAGLEALLESTGTNGSVGEGAGMAHSSRGAGGFTRVKSASPYQIIIQRCESCRSAVFKSGRGEQRLSESSYERIACDARVLTPGKANRATVPPAVRRAVLARDGHHCQAKGCGSTHFLEVHHLKPRSQGGSHRAENMVTLCSACHQLLHEKGLAGALLGSSDDAWIPHPG